jgi:hypothetical protein
VQLPSAGSVRLWAAVLVPALLLAAGCGSSKKSTSSTSATSAPATLALSITESGKASKFTAPASTKGGLVTVRLTNDGKKLHGAQLFRITGGHTLQQAIQATAGESSKTPDWIRAQGGIGAAAPGQTQAATVSLPTGKYAVVDFAGAEEGPSSAPPAIAEMTVTPGTVGSLPATATTVTATAPAKDKYRWQISGPLKAGTNEITFASKGSDALHHIVAVRLTEDVPVSQVLKDLEKENAPPPNYVDKSVNSATAVLDGGKSEDTQLILPKSGKYIFLCHLTDRDGGKPHFAEGLITKVNVQ